MTCCTFCGDEGARLYPVKGYSERLKACRPCGILLAVEQLGAGAFDAGQTVKACPFGPGEFRDAWLDGYLHAQDFDRTWFDQAVEVSA